MSLESTIALVEQWAHDRNLIRGSDPLKQERKLMEEILEWHEDYVEGKDIRMEFGDALVVLVIMAKQMGITFEECLSLAYDKIKDRKGEMRDGVFVKEEDL